MAAQNDRGIPLSALNPKFLHTNSTSHSWPFSAIAELIDNAHDPDVNGRQFWIDKTRIGDQDCLTFMDNGAGMDYDKMFKMLSFGFSDKVVINNHHPIGLYGNGFKSGSMRLGKDAIVFSRKRETMCVGMLSQTYLQEIQAENIFVPIVTFKRIGESIRPESQHAACLKDILQYSLFKTEKDLLAELEAIKTHDSKGSTGTRIIIWNIRKTSTNKSEFDFEVDRYDIKIPADVYESEKEKYKQYNPTHTSSPEMDYSLRAYCSVLYLKPKMQINIRGSKVKSQLISKSLAKVARDSYKPIFLKKETIPITFGYNPKSKEHYGVMMYHRNRLIKAYERVGCQKKGNNRGVGVIAVIECNFLKPTHNKQDFDHTDEYRKIIHTLGVKLEDYWKAKRYEKGLSSTDPEEDIPTNPDQKWVQCNDCQKWRKLPDGINVAKLPEEWFCRMNPDTEHRGCDKPEEAEDSEDETSSCLINYRQHERNLKRQQEQKKMQEQQRNVELTQQNDDLRRTKEDLIQKLQETSPSPSRSSLRNFGSSRSLGGISSPPQSNQMPVITGVMSLSSSKRKKSNLREKSECQALKKARILKGFCNNNADKPSTSKAVSYVLTSDMEISNSNDSVDKDDVKSISDNDGDDDDIVIDETKSTPKPKAPTFDLANVKFERITSNDVHNSDPVSIETPITSTIPTTSTITTDPLFSSGQASITTQTECGLGVKMEEDQQRKEEMELKREQVEDAATHVEICSVEETNRSLSDHMEIERCKSANLVTIQSLSDGSVRQTGVLSATAEEQFPVDPNPNIYHIPTVEAQEQQDNLLELMNVTAQERDEFKMKVQSLTLELDKKELKLLELTVKREFSHKYIQTDPVHEKDFETLYLQAKQHNEKLTQTINEHKKNLEDIHLQMKAEKEAQDWMKSQAGPSKAADLEDDMALQMGVLLSELDQRNSECNDLKSKLDCLEEERNRMQKDLEELRKHLEECRNTASSANHVNQMREEGETNERSEEGESIVIKAKLRDLRRSVARLLVTFVPALDPEQVNYDCDVIDEILNQVIQEIPSATTSS